MKNNLPVKMLSLASVLTFSLSIGQVLTRNISGSKAVVQNHISSKESGDCSSQAVPSNNFENGMVIGGEMHQRVANDISVGSTGYPIYGVELNLIAEENSNLNISFNILDGNAGLPWGTVAERTGTVLSRELLHEEEGFNVYKYRVAFDTPVDLEANNRYWIEVVTDADWEISTASSLNAPIAYANDETGGAWTFYPGMEGVFSLICEDPSLGTQNNAVSANFAAYPNPVKDVLNFKTDKVINTVEIYSLSGQKVTEFNRPKQSSVNVASLTPGIYMVKVLLEGGEQKALNINKK